MATRTLSRKGSNGRRRVLKGNQSFGIDADLSGLNAFLGELEEAAAEALRPAAQAATQVLYDRVRLNVQALGSVTGNLERSIYQAFSPEHSAAGQRAQYHVSWNHIKAPHGHLVEFGYLQRYRYYQDDQGRVRPMVRPGMDGKDPPGRRASQAEKDAYYVTVPTPKQVPGKAFVRSAGSALPDAIRAAEDELRRRIFERGAYYGA